MDTVHIQRGETLRRAQPMNFIGGFVEGAKRGDVELVPTVGIGFAHGGIIHAAVYQRCRDMIVAGLQEAGPLDVSTLPSMERWSQKHPIPMPKANWCGKRAGF